MDRQTFLGKYCFRLNNLNDDTYMSKNDSIAIEIWFNRNRMYDIQVVILTETH